jgi:NitT/TauT family transport system permease protein
MSAVGFARLSIIILAIGLLELLCRLGVIPNFTVIPPSAMAQSLWKILASGKFGPDIATTLANVGIAIVAAMLFGVAFGTLLQSSPALRRVFDPLFATYYAVPMYAFYPLLIVIFGLGDFPQIAIGFLLAVMAVIINTLNGLDRVPAVLLKTARVHRLGALATALRVRLPHAAPYVFTGFKLAVAYSFIGVIGAEFITSSRGIGYEISFAYNNFDNAVMYAMILFILLLVVTVNMSLHAWEKRLLARRQRLL